MRGKDIMAVARGAAWRATIALAGGLLLPFAPFITSTAAREATVPPPARATLLGTKQCARTAADRPVQWVELGQTDPRALRRLHVTSAGQQGLAGTNDRRSAVTGQRQDYARDPCGAPTPLSRDGIAAAIVADADLHDPADTALVAILMNGGVAQAKGGPVNRAMVDFWARRLREKTAGAPLEQLNLVGMSLGGALAIALAAELAPALPETRITIAAIDPTGRPGGAGEWLYDVAPEKIRHPRSRWPNDFVWTIADTRAWDRPGNVYGRVWTSGDALAFHNPAWGAGGAFGPITWHDYAHQDVGMNWKPHLHLQIPAFLRERQHDPATGAPRGLAPYALPQATPR